MNSITLARPDDWHIHLRDGALLHRTVPDAARQFKRVIAMPNLKPPVTTTAMAAAYRDRILAALPEHSSFEPLMTLYLTDNTPPDEILRAKESGIAFAAKLYPAGATTHSDAGVKSLDKISNTLEAMAEADLPLLIHGEVTDPDVDVFDREKVFIDRHLRSLVQRFPTLRIVLEHITTADAVDYVKAAPASLAATITAHHLLLNRNAMFAGGIRPHHYCLPVLKRETHRQALVAAATSGNSKFFLGTDSAPHSRSSKETACGCAGIYTAHVALELYAEVFAQAGQLSRLEGFASHFGADFYGLPRNSERVTLVQQSQPVPAVLPFGSEELIPYRAGLETSWRIQAENSDGRKKK